MGAATARHTGRWAAAVIAPCWFVGGAGFSPDEVVITAEQNELTVEGSKAQKTDNAYLYQGISARPFRRVFNLADYVQVKGASFENGLLKIDLVREVPEAMKPRRIAIEAATAKPTIEQNKAA